LFPNKFHTKRKRESREYKPSNKSKITKNSSWRFYQKSAHDMSEL